MLNYTTIIKNTLCVAVLAQSAYASDAYHHVGASAKSSAHVESQAEANCCSIFSCLLSLCFPSQEASQPLPPRHTQPVAAPQQAQQRTKQMDQNIKEARSALEFEKDQTQKCIAAKQQTAEARQKDPTMPAEMQAILDNVEALGHKLTRIDNNYSVTAFAEWQRELRELHTKRNTVRSQWIIH